MIGSFKSSPFPLFFGGSLGADITAPSHWSHLHKQAEPVLEQASAVHHPKAVDGELFPPSARLSLLATIPSLVDASLAVAVEASIESVACSEELTILWLRWLSTRLTTRLLITVVCRLLWSCR